MNSKASSKKNIATNSYILLTSLMFSLSSCNVYRSEGRKSLESAGPPPGSIRTTSVGFLKIASNQDFQLDAKTFDVCKLSSIESKICSENFRHRCGHRAGTSRKYFRPLQTIPSR